ncbi:MAG: wax ester/triacylglycerol synthase family O-acyltransferase [Micropruina sp.]|uniref:wax ester/triacylglycerol synthase domain-containing protein n=1 Tax=Micropruina sp. TaxID=2737536 RepID=UPI0039E64B59
MADPVSMTESLLLARDQPAQPWHQLSMLVVDGSAPTPATLARLIGQRIGYAPRFRQKLAGTGLQSWIDDRGFRVAGHLKTATLPAGAAIEAWLADQLALPLDRLHPLWDATILSGLPGGAWALVVRTHPALIDGADHVHLLHELLDEQPTPIAGEPIAWEPAAEEAPGFTGLLRNLGDPVRALKDAAAGLGGLAQYGVRQATTVATPRQVAAVECALADLKLVAAGAGCTVHDVIVALATAGVRGAQISGERLLHEPVALIPLAVDDDGASALGCLVAAQFVQLPVTAITARERLDVIATLTQARIDSDRLVPARELTELAGFPPPSSHAVAAATVTSGRPHEVLIANVPGPSTPRWLGEQRVRALHAFASTVDDQVITVGVSSLADRVSFAASAVVPLPRFARDVAEELGVLLRAVR